MMLTITKVLAAVGGIAGLVALLKLGFELSDRRAIRRAKALAEKNASVDDAMKLSDDVHFRG